MALRSRPSKNLSAGLLAQKLESPHTRKASGRCQHLDSLCKYPTPAPPHAACTRCLWSGGSHIQRQLPLQPPTTCTLTPSAPPCWLPESRSMPTTLGADCLLPALPPGCPAAPDRCQPDRTMNFFAAPQAIPHLLQ